MFTLIVTVSVFLMGVGSVETYVAPTEPPSKIEVMLDRLAECESGNNERAYNPKDSNGLPSWGLLQFQEKTWIANGGKMEDIWDGQKQREIAKGMLEKGLWKNWYNCGLRIGLDKL